MGMGRYSDVILLFQVRHIFRMSLWCSLIKDFEREARADGMPAAELATRKKARVQQLNAFIMQKKEVSVAQEGRQQLLADNKGMAERSPEGVTVGL
jgi:hypothetical protein